MTKAELKALMALWDNPPGTARALGLTPYLCRRMVELGLADARKAKRRPDYVGKHKTIYSLSDAGKREALLTGKRFVPTLVE